MAAGAWAAGPGLPAQETCRPPRDLRVCQDTYGSTGRAFLAWTNGESTYTRIRVFVDGAPAGEAPGDAVSRYVSALTPGPHTFAVEGECGGTASARASAGYTILASTPHTQPIDSITCQFEAAQSRLTAQWVPSSTPSLFLDVYVRRSGVNGLIYVTSLLGTVHQITIVGARETDRLRLQFFDANCYGSELVACESEPACLPPVGLRICQDLYGTRPRVFYAWAPDASDYTAFEVFLDGAPVGEVGAGRGLFYLQPVSVGQHTFGLRGRCGEEASAMVTRSFTVLDASPHLEPARNLHCQRDPVQEAISATWLPGAEPSDFIDVYVRRPGVALLDFAGTIPGDRTRVRVPDAGADDEVVLQFFNADCYGSPLLSCGEDPGSREFLRGDANGSGKVDLSDAVALLGFLFLGSAAPLCVDAADANDDAKSDIADAVYILSWLFEGGADPPPPGPTTCGPDPTADAFPGCLTAACP